jgi:2-succinyl-6-hydroxy-2,4-cyclohexadiene-1-carboxylate synthase
MSPSLVLLHGFTHTGQSWDAVARALPERYRPLAPDIRGHGASSGSVPVNLESVIGDVSQLAPSSFTLVGYSMGGRIALHAALALADRIDRLVLVGASPGIADRHERDARRAADEQLAADIQRLSIQEFARRWADTPVLAGQPPEVAAAAYADRLKSTPAGLARALHGLGTGALPSLWDRLGELRMPLVLVVGERDSKFRATAQRIAGAALNAEIVIVPGAGHAVHLEAPDRLAEVICAG